RDGRGVAVGGGGDLLAVDDDVVVVVGHVTRERSVVRVVLEQESKGLVVGQVVHHDDVESALGGDAEDLPADPSEAVDSDSHPMTSMVSVSGVPGRSIEAHHSAPTHPVRVANVPTRPWQDPA